MNLIKFGLPIAVLTLAATAAHAQDEPTRWPRAYFSRPLTLPSGLFQVGTDFLANHDFSAVAETLVAGYGINDKLEINGYYTFALEEFESKGQLDVNVGFAAIRGAVGGKLEVIPRAQIGYDFLAEGMNPFKVGAQAVFNLTDKVQLITPGQQLSIALEEVGEDGDKPVAFGLPVALGFQATPELFFQIDTKLATLGISDSDDAIIFSDETPLRVTGIFNVMPALDVSAGFGFSNLTPPDGTDLGDTMEFVAGIRYYGGQL